MIETLPGNVARSRPRGSSNQRSPRSRRVRLRLAGPLLVDPYTTNRQTGAFVLVDEATNETVGAGMVLAATA